MATGGMSALSCVRCSQSEAKFYCDTCRNALCRMCITQHLRNKHTRDHDIEPYSYKHNQKCTAVPGLAYHIHPNNVSEFWCETCADKHNIHVCSDDNTILSVKRDKSVEDMKTLRNKTVAEWEDVLKQAQTITVGYLAKIEEIDKDLVTRAKEMHEQVDVILSRNKRTLQHLKACGLAKLKGQEKYLTDCLHRLNKDPSAYPSFLFTFNQSATQIRVKPKALETASVPIFTRGQDDIRSLEHMFGYFITHGVHISDETSPAPQQTSDRRQLKISSDSETFFQSTQVGSIKFQDRALILKPIIESHFDVSYNTPQIACTDQGLAWVETKYQTLQLVDRCGLVVDTMETDICINDMTLTSDGEILLADRLNRCIKSISRNKEITTLFRTSWEPTGLCCLCNDIVVSFAYSSKVIVYSRTGHPKRTFDHIRLRYPYKVSVNKANQDICICNHEGAFSQRGKLLAVGSDNQLRYEYPGHGIEFSPAGVCTDAMGHVLVIDTSSKGIHILDKEGHFIQHLLSGGQGMGRPYSIDVDRQGYVWMGECVITGRVTVSKYLQ